jgi:mannosyltransferase
VLVALVVLATAAAAALRWWHLGAWSFWIDEAHTFRDATMPLSGDNGFLASDRAFYPLAFLAVRALLALGLVGGDEASLRLPFACLGIAAVPLVAWLGRRLVGAKAAVLASWFVALSPWHVFWSQNARGYGLVFLVAVVAANRAAAWVDTGRRVHLLQALLAIVLGTGCHATGALQAGALLAFAVVRRMPELRGRRVVWTLAVVAAVAWVLPPLVVWLAPYQGFFQAKSGASLLHFVQTCAYYFRPLTLLAALVGLWAARDHLPADRVRLLACLGLVPVLLLALLSSTVLKATARYALCVLPVVFWLAALGIVRLAAALPAASSALPALARWAAVAALPALLVLDLAVQTAHYHTTQLGQRGDWRAATAAARELAGSDRLYLLTVNLPSTIYYLRPDFWARGDAAANRHVQVHQLAAWEFAGLWRGGGFRHQPGGAEHLAWHAAAAAQQRARFAVLVSRPELEEMDIDGSFWRLLEQQYELVEHWPCRVGPKDEGIYLFVPRAP